MVRCALVVLGFLTAGSTTWAAQTQQYLPLREENSWTYYQSHPMARFAPWTVSVDDSIAGVVYHLSDYPGVRSPIWVTWSGTTLYAWNELTESWVVFLRFGASIGTTYTVDLGVEGFSGVQVRILSRSARVTSVEHDRTYYNCIKFSFLRPGDARAEEYFFARNVGLVRWTNPWASSLTFGDIIGTLGPAVVGGRNLGAIGNVVLESGSYSGMPTSGWNQVRLINTASQWASFYAAHNPGSPAPEVDFTSHSVIAILAGERATSGYSLELERATWNYPYAGARVRIIERAPGGIVMPATSKPFAIYVLDSKVYSVSIVSWTVVAPDPPTP